MQQFQMKTRLMTAAAAALGLSIGACGSTPHAQPASLGGVRAKATDATTTSGSSAGAMTCGAGSCSGHDAGVGPSSSAR